MRAKGNHSAFINHEDGIRPANLREPVRDEQGCAPLPRARCLGTVDYAATCRAMREFTAARSADTFDEIWLLEHPPVYTLGVAGRSEHLPRGANSIPVIKVDRGGQITYHGPGQLVVYLLLDMRRRGLTVRPLVRIMERAVIGLLAAHGVGAEARAEAPGVYVDGSKIAALVDGRPDATLDVRP